MVPKKSAGLLLYRFNHSVSEFFLVHPGGPFWKNKDLGAWSIPKGEFTDEDPLSAAIREFKEETSLDVSGKFIPLQPLKQKSGKVIYGWAVECDADTSKIKSNEFDLEWPPKSGRMIKVPEVDRAEWFNADDARSKIISGQANFIDQLEELLVQGKN